MEEISFKSTETFFYKEKKGIKNNTVRKLSFFAEDDYRLNLLKAFENGKINELEIEINLSGNRYLNDFFTRKVTDVSFYEDIVIITFSQFSEDEEDFSY